MGYVNIPAMNVMAQHRSACTAAKRSQTQADVTLSPREGPSSLGSFIHSAQNVNYSGFVFSGADELRPH